MCVVSTRGSTEGKVDENRPKIHGRQTGAYSGLSSGGGMFSLNEILPGKFRFDLIPPPPCVVVNSKDRVLITPPP